MKIFLSLLLTGICTAPAPAEEKAPPAKIETSAPLAAGAVKHVNAGEASKALADAKAAAATSPEKAITVIDVRTPEEFASGHIGGAQNLDIASPEFKANLAKLDRGKTYLVHCAAGGRSTRSLSILKDLGFKSLIHLDEGLNAWKAAGLPLEKSAAQKP